MDRLLAEGDARVECARCARSFCSALCRANHVCFAGLDEALRTHVCPGGADAGCTLCRFRTLVARCARDTHAENEGIARFVKLRDNYLKALKRVRDSASRHKAGGRRREFNDRSLVCKLRAAHSTARDDVYKLQGRVYESLVSTGQLVAAGGFLTEQACRLAYRS